MSKLKLAADLSLPVEVVTQTMAILAKRRAGKSYTMRRLAAQLPAVASAMSASCALSTRVRPIDSKNARAFRMRCLAGARRSPSTCGLTSGR